MKRTLIILGTMLLVSACGKQDPMAGQPEDIRNGHPPGEEKAKPTFGSDSLVFESQDFYNMKEGETQTITIQARCTLDTPSYEIIFRNQGEFENVQVKTVKGSHTNKGVMPAQITITWTPKNTSTDFMQVTSFDLVATSSDLGISRSKSIPVHIEKKSVAPQILRDQGMPTSIREGQQVTGTIFVNDVSSEDIDGKRPMLHLVSESMGVPQLSQFVSVSMPRLVSAGLWSFDVRFDLRNEVTASKYNTSLKFVATNRFGLVSSEKMYSVDVLSNVERPQTSWVNKQVVTFKVGQKNSYSFWVLDPKFEGNLTWSVDSSSDLSKWAGKASLDCQYVTAPNGSSNSEAFCQLNWEIPAGTTDKTKNFKLNVKNTSKIPNDNLSVTDSFEREIVITP